MVQLGMFFWPVDQGPEVLPLAVERGWVRGFWEALRPHALGSGAGYINGVAEYSGDGGRGSYGTATYERLARIKAEYDPDNMFHLNANIPPTAHR
jgi:FAD/FMN-containing dehydrogenase